MKKVSLAFVLGASTLLCGLPTARAQLTSVTSCKSTDCAALGYAQTEVEDCVKYIRCPFDNTYKACVRFCEDDNSAIKDSLAEIIADVTGNDADFLRTVIDEEPNGALTDWATTADLPPIWEQCRERFGISTSDSEFAVEVKTIGDLVGYISDLKCSTNNYLTTCPDGAVCSAKYMLTSCQDGYDLSSSGSSCISNMPTCGSEILTSDKASCPTGYTCQKCTTPVSGSLTEVTEHTEVTGCADGYSKVAEIVKSYSLQLSTSTDILSNVSFRCVSGTIDSNCALDTVPGNILCNSSDKYFYYYVLTDGKYYVPHCGSCSDRLSDDGKCIIGCASTITIDPISCPSGYSYTSASAAFAACSKTYGIASSGGCYACCTAADWTSGSSTAKRYCTKQ